MKNNYKEEKKSAKMILKHYIKSSFKSVSIWTLAVSSIMVLIVAMYPFFEDSLAALADISPEMSAFIDLFTGGGINNVADFYILEGGQMYLLVGSFFAAFMGFNAFKKEIIDGIYEYIYSLPIKRKSIFKAKFVSGFINIILFNMVIAATSIASMYLIIGDISFNMLNFFYYFVISALIGLIIFSIFFAFGAILKSKAHLGIAAGIVLYLYIANFMAEISSSLVLLKILTPFSLLKTSSPGGLMDIGINSLDLIRAGGWSIFSIVLICISLKLFNNSDIKN